MPEDNGKNAYLEEVKKTAKIFMELASVPSENKNKRMFKDFGQMPEDELNDAADAYEAFRIAFDEYEMNGGVLDEKRKSMYVALLEGGKKLYECFEDDNTETPAPQEPVSMEALRAKIERIRKMREEFDRTYDSIMKFVKGNAQARAELEVQDYLDKLELDRLMFRFETDDKMVYSKARELAASGQAACERADSALKAVQAENASRTAPQ